MDNYLNMHKLFDENTHYDKNMDEFHIYNKHLNYILNISINIYNYINKTNKNINDLPYPNLEDDYLDPNTWSHTQEINYNNFFKISYIRRLQTLNITHLSIIIDNDNYEYIFICNNNDNYGNILNINKLNISYFSKIYKYIQSLNNEKELIYDLNEKYYKIHKIKNTNVFFKNNLIYINHKKRYFFKKNYKNYNKKLCLLI